MISRGHFIGEIVDALATVAERVEMRAALGLTDLNRYTEDFVKQILNQTLDLQLVNVNEERSNSPGIDLLDTTASVGFQVTAERSSRKVNETLDTVASLAEPPTILYVLIIGKKQTSYTLQGKGATTLNFSPDHVWDFTDLAKAVVGLSLDVLQDLYSYISRELARVRIELELPTPEGEYPTSIAKYVEEIPTPTLGDFGRVREYLVEQHEDEEEVWSQTADELREFVRRLSRLPRITREFFLFLLERADESSPDEYGRYEFDYNRLKRICRYPDHMEEIDLLSDADLVRFYAAEHHEERTQVVVREVGKTGFLLVALVEVAARHGLSLQRALVSLDFSGYSSVQESAQRSA